LRKCYQRPRSPWQRAYVERIIGSIRRECLDHVIVLGEGSLRRTLVAYFDFYHKSRTHLPLGKDSPEPRPIQPPEIGPVVARRQVGGLHHRYERHAACWSTKSGTSFYRANRKSPPLASSKGLKTGTRISNHSELEANRFAAEILMPRGLMAEFVQSEPSLESIRSISSFAARP
jgi:hypothetical protein